jgi:hypothetical protein
MGRGHPHVDEREIGPVRVDCDQKRITVANGSNDLDAGILE